MSSILDLIRGLDRERFEAGHEILKEGGRTAAVYFLEDGEVRITKRGVEIDTVSTPGSIFGELSVLMDRPHMATVTVTRPSSFLVARDARNFFLSNPEVHLHLSRLLAKRLTSVTNYLVDLKKQFYENQDHLGMVDEVLEALVHTQEEEEY